MLCGLARCEPELIVSMLHSDQSRIALSMGPLGPTRDRSLWISVNALFVFRYFLLCLSAVDFNDANVDKSSLESG